MYHCNRYIAYRMYDWWSPYGRNDRSLHNTFKLRSNNTGTNNRSREKILHRCHWNRLGLRTNKMGFYPEHIFVRWWEVKVSFVFEEDWANFFQADFPPFIKVFAVATAVLCCPETSVVKLTKWRNIVTLKGYCTPGPYFLRLCTFSQKIKQLRAKYPMDLVRNVPRNSNITILLQ